MRLALLLSLFTLPGLAAANPVQDWADSRCPPSPPATHLGPLKRFVCVKMAATQELDSFKGRQTPDDAAREWVADDSRDRLRLEALKWEHRMCEVRTVFTRLDVATSTLRLPDAQTDTDLLECQSWMYSWLGHFADALRRADEAALKDNLTALESRAKPGPAPTPRLLAAAKLLAGREPPQQAVDLTRYSRPHWNSLIVQLTHAWRLPRQLAALRCRAQEQRGVAVPEQCEERVRRALEAELLPATQALTEAASWLPAEELRAAEASLAQEPPRVEKPTEKQRHPHPGERVFGATLGSLPESVTGGAVNGAIPFGAGMTPPERIQGEPLQLSPEALAMRVQGTIIFRFTIQPTGEVTNIRTIKPLPHMDETLRKTVATWRYKPVLFEGRPIAVDYTVSQEFSRPSRP
jgi:TonB family protein